MLCASVTRNVVKKPKRKCWLIPDRSEIKNPIIAATMNKRTDQDSAQGVGEYALLSAIVLLTALMVLTQIGSSASRIYSKAAHAIRSGSHH